jgi:hypothetical protein
MYVCMYVCMCSVSMGDGRAAVVVRAVGEEVGGLCVYDVSDDDGRVNTVEELRAGPVARAVWHPDGHSVFYTRPDPLLRPAAVRRIRTCVRIGLSLCLSVPAGLCCGPFGTLGCRHRGRHACEKGGPS